MKKILLLLFLITGTLSSNAQSNDNSTSPKTEMSDDVKIYIDADGTISIDEKTKSLEELNTIFKKLKKNAGTVYYSASPECKVESLMEFINLVIKYELKAVIISD